MPTRLAPRLLSFALAMLVTWTIFSGIETLALKQHSAAMQVSDAAGATQVALSTAAAHGYYETVGQNW